MGKIILILFLLVNSNLFAQRIRPFATNGVDGYATLANTIGLLPRDEAFTISFWAFCTVTPVDYETVINTYDGGPLNCGWQLWTWPTQAGGNCVFALFWDGNPSEFWGYSTPAIKLYSWHNYIFSYNGQFNNANSVSVYVDGTSVTVDRHSNTGITALPPSGVPLTIGGAPVGTGCKSSFMLFDEIIITSGTITPSQAKQFFKRRLTVNIKDKILVSVRNIGNRLTDTSGNNRHSSAWNGMVYSTMPCPSISGGRE